MIISRLISTALILGLAACAAAVDPGSETTTTEARAAQAAAVVPSNRAQVFLFRKNAFAGSANAYRIAINGQPVGDMTVGTRLAQLIAPGTVTVSAETVPNPLNFGFALALMERPTVSLSARGGTTYAIEVSTGFGGGPVLTIVPEATALAASTGFTTARAAR